MGVNEKVSFIYQDSYYQTGGRVTPWFDGERIDATILAILGNVAMICPHCSGHEMLVWVSKLRKKKV